MFDKIKTGQRIKLLRKKNKMNQIQLSEVTGTTREAISLYENGEKGMSIEVLCKLADYFNISTDYLLGRTDDDRPFRDEPDAPENNENE